MKKLLYAIDFAAALLMAMGILAAITIVITGTVHEVEFQFSKWWSNVYGRVVIIGLGISILWMFLRGKRLTDNFKD